MNITRDQATKTLTYGTLQALVECAIEKIDDLKEVDQSQLKIHIFNHIAARAKALKVSA